MSGDDLRAGLEALVETWEREGAERGPDDTLYTSGVAAMLRHLLDAHPTPSEPEATVVEEWGVRKTGGYVATTEKWRDQVDWLTEASARRVAVDEGGTVVRRTRTTYADRVTEWEEADR